MSSCLYCDRKLKLGLAVCQQHERMLATLKPKPKAKPEYYVSYRGHVVAFHKNGGTSLKPDYLGMVKIPRKAQQINLDEFCKGYSREQIRKLKTCVMRLAGIRGNIPRDWQDKPEEQPKRTMRFVKAIA